MSNIPPFPGDQYYNPVTRRFLERLGSTKLDVDVQIANLQSEDINLQNKINAINSSISDIDYEISGINESIENLNTNNNGYYCYDSYKPIIEATETGLFEISLPQNSSISGMVNYTVKVTSGSDFQIITGICNFVAINKSGTIYPVCNLIGNQLGAWTWSSPPPETPILNDVTIGTGTNKIIFNLTPTSNLSNPSIRAYWRVWWHGDSTSVTPL